MSDQAKVWVFRAAAALVSVAISAIAGIRPDMAHFGMWFPLVAVVQMFVLAGLGNLVRKWMATP